MTVNDAGRKAIKVADGQWKNKALRDKIIFSIDADPYFGPQSSHCASCVRSALEGLAPEGGIELLVTADFTLAFAAVTPARLLRRTPAAAFALPWQLTQYEPRNCWPNVA